MPFMIGKAPIRRTTQYLEMGKIIFRETVKIFSINYNTEGDHHEGAREFVFWYLPQVQYKNPDIQCSTFLNMTPSPFIKIYFEDGKSELIDIDSRQKEEIHDYLKNFTAVCKSEYEIEKEKKFFIDESNPSFFGYKCKRHCICEVIGQVPCPAIVSVPNVWKGIKNKKLKYRIPPQFLEPGLEEEEKEEED